MQLFKQKKMLFYT